MACKEIAASKDITATEIWLKTGIKRSYLSMLFSGSITNPSVRKVYAIAHCLGVTVDEIVEYADAH